MFRLTVCDSFQDAIPDLLFIYLCLQIYFALNNYNGMITGPREQL